jgi:hypothetical protein
MERFFTLDCDSTRKGWAVICESNTEKVFNPVQDRFYPIARPGPVIFRWFRDLKRKPDLVGAAAFYPIVSTRLKEFCESRAYSGVEFFPAHVEKDSASDGSWWAMYPTCLLDIDTKIWGGDVFGVCEKSGFLVTLRPGLLGPGFVSPIEAVSCDFFRPRNIVQIIAMYCKEHVVNEMVREKFKNLEFREVTAPEIP